MENRDALPSSDRKSAVIEGINTSLNEVTSRNVENCAEKTSDDEENHHSSLKRRTNGGQNGDIPEEPGQTRDLTHEQEGELGGEASAKGLHHSSTAVGTMDSLTEVHPVCPSFVTEEGVVQRTSKEKSMTKEEDGEERENGREEEEEREKNLIIRGPLVGVLSGEDGVFTATLPSPPSALTEVETPAIRANEPEAITETQVPAHQEGHLNQNEGGEDDDNEDEDEDEETRRLLRSCVVRVDGPMENLPALVVPEYASLGRCVVFEKSLTGIRPVENGTSVSQPGSSNNNNSNTNSSGRPVENNATSNTSSDNTAPTSFIYMGIVSVVTADCLTLLRCCRFTVEDFERRVSPTLLIGDAEHGQRDPGPRHSQPEAQRMSSTQRSGSGVTDASQGDPANRTTGMGENEASDVTPMERRAAIHNEVELDAEEGEADQEDLFALLEMQMGKVEAQQQQQQQQQHQKETAAGISNGARSLENNAEMNRGGPSHHHPQRHVAHPLLQPPENVARECLSIACSMGPMSYATFQRSSIHNVRYLRRPPLHECFSGSLFCRPDNRRHDLQWLRLFVRQYLILSSQGRNPKGISLKQFINWAGKCEMGVLDDNFLEQVAKEELEFLVRLHGKIERSRLLLHNHRSGADPLEIRNRSVVLRLLLLQTGVPKLSFISAAVECCVAVFILTFGFVAYFFSLSHLVVSFLQANWQFVFGGAFVGFAAAGLTAYHAGTMSPPLSSQVYMAALRLFVSACAIAYCTLTGIAFTSFLTVNSMTEWAKSSNVELTDALRSALRRLCLPLAIANIFLVAVLLMDMVFVAITMWVLRRIDLLIRSGRNRLRLRVRLGSSLA